MTDCGRSTSDRSGWVGCTKRRGGSWIISAAPLAERVGITREGVTNQLITKCHLSSELFTSRALPCFRLREAPNLSPVLRPYVFINLDRYSLTVETIRTVPARSGNPKVLTGLDVVEVGLEPAAPQSPERAATIVDRLPELGHLNAPDSRWARETVGL